METLRWGARKPQAGTGLGAAAGGCPGAADAGSFKRESAIPTSIGCGTVFNDRSRTDTTWPWAVPGSEFNSNPELHNPQKPALERR